MGLINLILASRSPRRAQLLAGANYDFAVFPPEDVEEEAPQYTDKPHRVVRANAERKARAVFEKIRGEEETFLFPHDKGEYTIPLILGCDTIACVPAPSRGEGVCEILGKPADRADAERMLRLLSGKEHFVLTGIAILVFRIGHCFSEHDKTTLVMDKLTDEQIESYLNSGEWQGKAGAFGYQDGNSWLHVVSGSESNIVGLPMELLDRVLDSIEHHPFF